MPMPMSEGSGTEQMYMSRDLERFLANAKLQSLDDLRARHGSHAEDAWGLCALRGRLVELSARGASATLTTAIELVTEAQTEGEPVAWISRSDSGSGSFYPPDVAASGVDLAALVVIRVPGRVPGATEAARAAER